MITALSALDEAVAVQRIPQLVEGRKEAGSHPAGHTGGRRTPGSGRATACFP